MGKRKLTAEKKAAIASFIEMYEGDCFHRLCCRAVSFRLLYHFSAKMSMRFDSISIVIDT